MNWRFMCNTLVASNVNGTYIITQGSDWVCLAWRSADCAMGAKQECDSIEHAIARANEWESEHGTKPEHSPLYKILIADGPDWLLSDEGPWDSLDDAKRFAESEVGMPWVIMCGETPVEIGSVWGKNNAE